MESIRHNCYSMPTNSNGSTSINHGTQSGSNSTPEPPGRTSYQNETHQPLLQGTSSNAQAQDRSLEEIGAATHASVRELGEHVQELGKQVQKLADNLRTKRQDAGNESDPEQGEGEGVEVQDDHEDNILAYLLSIPGFDLIIGDTFNAAGVLSSAAALSSNVESELYKVGIASGAGVAFFGLCQLARSALELRNRNGVLSSGWLNKISEILRVVSGSSGWSSGLLNLISGTAGVVSNYYSPDGGNDVSKVLGILSASYWALVEVLNIRENTDEAFEELEQLLSALKSVQRKILAGNLHQAFKDVTTLSLPHLASAIFGTLKVMGIPLILAGSGASIEWLLSLAMGVTGVGVIGTILTGVIWLVIKLISRVKSQRDSDNKEQGSSEG